MIFKGKYNMLNMKELFGLSILEEENPGKKSLETW